jgi:predicted small lipoprotein YifL
MSMRTRLWVLAGLALMLLAGCGMKGDLTRPPPEAPPAAEASS